MKPLFKEPRLLSGILWRLSGVAVMVVSPAAGLTYTAHVLYWFLRIKLEYPNHAYAGVMILLCACMIQGAYYQAHAMELITVFLGYTLSGYIHAYLKTHSPSWRTFLRLRMRIYLVPLLYSLYLDDKDPFVATCFGMCACEFITYYLPTLIKE